MSAGLRTQNCFSFIGAVLIGLLSTDVASAQNDFPSSNLPFGQAPIDYYGSETDNVFAALIRDVSAGAQPIPFDDRSGYLRGLLAALEIPLESQALVFSKTSVQNTRIGPATPRAIYFNDEAAIGYIPGAPTLEVMAQDPVKGSICYVVPQVPEAFRPRREEQCLSCHVSSRTRGVAGFVIQSVETDDRGRPVSGVSQFRESTPIAERFGGWYVSGRAEGLIHRGNLRGGEEFARHRDDPTFRGAVPDLSPLVDFSAYPSSHSDLVAQLVLHHQAQGYNLLLRAGQSARLGRSVDVMDELVRCLMLVDSPAFPRPITGSSEFVKCYAANGPRDEQGRSLRDLALQSRVFRWHASPLLLTRTFQRLPDEVRTQVCSRMTRMLDGPDKWPGESPSEVERRATLEILRATVPHWPR